METQEGGNGEAITRHADTLKIGALAQASGFSKELIHHYLREGLLPRPVRRACYGRRHLHLLRLIKRLRDERFLPLPVIREIIEFHRHDPERIEIVLLSGSSSASAAAAATTSEPGDVERLTLDDLVTRTGIDRPTLKSWRGLGLVRPTGRPGAERYSRHDASALTLVQRGLALGIPLDSFRTIRTYVELAFELEKKSFLPGAPGKPDLADLAREVATRKEVANGFVLHALNALFDAQMRRLLDEAAGEAGGDGALDAAIYRPSDEFIQKHGLAQEIGRLHERIGYGHDPDVLARLLRLFFLAGRYREAIFVAEKLEAARSGDKEALRIGGWALAATGEAGRAAEVLAQARSLHPADPVAAAYLAAVRLHSMRGDGRVEAALRGLDEVMRLCDAALAAAAKTPAADREAAAAIEAQLACGWVLTSLPRLCQRFDEGLRVLEAAHAAASGAAVTPRALRLRFRLVGAAFLSRALKEADPAVAEGDRGRRRRALEQEVLSIDPASEFARAIFLESDTAEP